KKNINESNTSTSTENNDSISGGIDSTGPSGKINLGDVTKESEGSKHATEIEENFSSIFLQVFQIKTFIEELKEILTAVKIRHIVVLLDDFSEIDHFAIKTFVDVVLAPLNNWSDEFIKFKVAAYPNRIYYGKIDPGKVDTINLDFYALYSEFDRDKMESNAVVFTKRILTKRFQKFLQSPIDTFFDTSKNTMDDYYLLLFQTSMNVPRILGYILSYCYQSRINFNHKINKSDIESA